MEQYSLTLLHSEWSKLYGVLAILSAIGLTAVICLKNGDVKTNSVGPDLWICSLFRPISYHI